MAEDHQSPVGLDHPIYDDSHLSLSDILRISHILGYLQYSQQNRPEGAVLYDSQEEEVNYIYDVLNILHTELAESPNNFTAQPLINQRIREYRDKYDLDSLDESSEAIILSEEDEEQTREDAKTWVTLMTRDLSDQTRISVPEHGLFNAKKAMEHPKSLFQNQNIWSSLPEDIKRDLEEACRSLATGCPTGAVFLSLRAVEQYLHDWYREETGRQIEDRTFGQVLGELDDQYGDEDAPRVLDHLNFLVDRRNEVAHAEEAPDIGEAENTIFLTRTTISNISEKLET